MKKEILTRLEKAKFLRKERTKTGKTKYIYNEKKGKKSLKDHENESGLKNIRYNNPKETGHSANIVQADHTGGHLTYYHDPETGRTGHEYYSGPNYDTKADPKGKSYSRHWEEKDLPAKYKEVGGKLKKLHEAKYGRVKPKKESKAKKPRSDSAEDFTQYLEETLIPDTRESGREFTAEDYETCVEYIKGEKVSGKKEFVDYLKNTLIPDLRESKRDGSADDFEEAIHWMTKGASK